MESAARYASLFAALLLALASAPARADNCTGTPADAVMTLPDPLSQWGSLYCTPYGHVLAAREGWIWSRMGAYAPVFVPSQMVRNNPASVGNQSYFTRIDMAVVDLAAAERALSEFRKIFPADGTPSTVYRLDLTSISQRVLQLYFMEFTKDKRTDLWGIWCSDTNCARESMFMLLDMAKRAADKKPQ